MSHLIIHSKVPEVYVAESRDFQLFTSILEIVENSVLNDTDSVKEILDTKLCKEPYLEPLLSKVGAVTKIPFTVSPAELRVLADVFPHILKSKGSMKGVSACVNAFCRSQGVYSPDTVQIEYVNEMAYNEDPITTVATDTVQPAATEIRITFRGVKNVNEKLLRYMLEYVVPAGFFISVHRE